MKPKPKRIRGGFYVLQATNYGDGEGWHPHINVAYDGEYINKQVIRAMWRDITGGSYIVKINEIKTPYRAIAYLLADFTTEWRIAPQYAQTYDGVFKGSRLVQPFGEYRSVKLRVPFPCPVCGNTDWITMDVLDNMQPCWEDDP